MSLRTASGVLDARAEIEIDGSTVVFKDIAMYAADKRPASERLPIGIEGVMQLRRRCAELAAAAGYDRVGFAARRMSGPMGGRDAVRSIDVSRYLSQPDAGNQSTVRD